MLKEEIDQLIGYNPDLEPHQQMSTVEYVIRFSLVSAMAYFNARRADPDHAICLSSQSTLAAACAWLMVAFQADENPTDAAWTIAEAIEDGQDLYVWAAGELAKRGIVVPE